MIFHHLGVATESIEHSLPGYLQLGYSVDSKKYEDNQLGVNCQFLVHDTAPRIELVEALSGSKVLEPWLRSGSRIYHVAFEVSVQLESIVLPKGRLIVSPKEAVAFPGKRVMFHMSSERRLIEYIGP
jgi:methylmalonyl-CoA/ethylmalonyl-CoA epimerase